MSLIVKYKSTNLCIIGIGKLVVKWAGKWLKHRRISDIVTKITVANL